MNIESIKSIVDSCISKNILEVEPEINNLLDKVIAHILQSYNNSRNVLQYTLGQLDRIHKSVVCIMMKRILNHVQDLCDKFENESCGDNNYVNVKWSENKIGKILTTAASYYQGNFRINNANMEFANSLSSDERRTLVSYIIDSIQHYGTDTHWTKDIIENHLLYLAFLYAICKKDSQMWYMFHYANNFIDRLATSNEAQATRDIAETILMIGHQENMEAEGYFCASRAYTIQNNSVAGLFYMEIALKKWQEQPSPIRYKSSFEILWQILKLARNISFASETHLKPIAKCFEALNPLPYDINSFYHTYLSLMFYSKGLKVLEDIADFLDKHREIVYKNLDHGAMPWLSLIFTVKLNFPSANLSRLNPYINAFKSVVNRKGNAMMLDLFDGENEDIHLKELMVKLESTRNVEDYSHDNHLAMIFSKSLITKSTLECNPSKYLLAMLIRADYTFVKSEIAPNNHFMQTKFRDINGVEYNLPIEDTKILETLMQLRGNDEVLWIGKGTSCLHFMAFLQNHFAFGNLSLLTKVNIEKLQSNTIRFLNYERDVKKPGEPIYTKDISELEQEAEDLKNNLSDCQIMISDNANRLLLVKDMDVAAYPHQLLIDQNKNEFIGSLLPTCNIISTEVLIKTNFEEPFHEHPSCAFWSPLNCSEFTFEIIKSKLQDIFATYNFALNKQNIPDRPIDAEINIACAHGGADISDTQWFYADDEPIVETNKIIGKGKLLILFVCHSGSFTRPDYDNAMHTLIKRYIRVGYSSVIAPMWSLNTEILPTWLSTFMREVTSGQFVIDALFQANMAVKEEYICPEVYACLHLFGNPFLQIAEKPILEIKEETL